MTPPAEEPVDLVLLRRVSRRMRKLEERCDLIEQANALLSLQVATLQLRLATGATKKSKKKESA